MNRSPLAITLALSAAAALLAACASGSSSSTKTSTAAAAATTSAAPTSAAAPAASGAIATATGPLGSYLVDKTGKAIYILTSDKPGGASACTAGCLKAWPPIATPSPLPSGIAGITATFGTFTAVDGSSELTINGYPAYNFIKDTGPGTTAGQGVVSFGGTWWLVSPSGSWITTAAASSSNAAASSSAATGGGAYGY
jgi:predicted lipoprotein with Yx(FWY)xxD motif